MIDSVMKRHHFLFITIILIATNLYAQRIAKYGGDFMSLGVGGRALALGGAYTALSTDAFASYYNPGALSHINYPEAVLMHEERFAGLVNYDFGAIAMPFGTESSVGLSVLRLGVDNIADTRLAGIDMNGNPVPPDQYDNAVRLDYSKIKYFTTSSWAIYGTYSVRHNEHFSYGFNIKVIRHLFVAASAFGIGFDIGAIYSPNERLIVGATLQDATTTLVSWTTGTTELISPTLKLGAVYSLPLFDGLLSPVVDVDVRFENRKTSSFSHLGFLSFDPHLGMEYDFKKTIALRVGMSELKQLTLGAGLHLRKLDVDYAFARFGNENSLGDTHRISLRIILQEERYARK